MLLEIVMMALAVLVLASVLGAVTNTVSQGATGTTTATAPATTGVAWNLSSLQISQAGGVVGPNAQVNIWDGAVGVKLLYSVFLSAPGAGYGGALAIGGSVGVIQDIPLPKDPMGVPTLVGTPGNAMNIQVIGTGGNQTIINARFSDGIPPN